ncbi:MAG: hypothetical protein L3K08_02425 [Thermoplasmata archaeon]|nr:hypothetical protein [Thermoplasmata archaeon]
MPGSPKPKSTPKTWTPIPDPPDRFSSGIADLDRLLGGGFPRGSMALFQLDDSIGVPERELVLTPIFLNFLAHSNGMIAVLPARESPHNFRAHLTRWIGRRLFDTRVRVVDYVGEDTDAPYVVTLEGLRGGAEPAKRKAVARKDMEKMVVAESAVRGAWKRPFIELISFEIAEIVAGPEVAARMFLHGIKRSRSVGNLCLGLLRTGLACTDAVRGMADLRFSLHRDEIGLILKGDSPAFPNHLVVADPVRGEPYVRLLPDA